MWVRSLAVVRPKYVGKWQPKNIIENGKKKSYMRLRIKNKNII